MNLNVEGPSSPGKARLKPVRAAVRNEPGHVRRGKGALRQGTWGARFRAQRLSGRGTGRAARGIRPEGGLKRGRSLRRGLAAFPAFGRGPKRPPDRLPAPEAAGKPREDRRSGEGRRPAESGAGRPVKTLRDTKRLPDRRFPHEFKRGGCRAPLRNPRGPPRERPICRALTYRRSGVDGFPLPARAAEGARRRMKPAIRGDLPRLRAPATACQSLWAFHPRPRRLLVTA
jgi:hypothetical protein